MSIDNLYLTKYARECNIVPCADRPAGCFYFSGFPKAYFVIGVEEINLSKRPSEIKNQILMLALQKVSRQLEKEKNYPKRCYNN